jgi:broad specificity phosphatase PhoE
VELVLVRHGHVEHDPGRRLADPELSALGRAQALALGERLAGERFDVCFASPLRRARETARLLVAERGPEPELHACLAEGSFGALDGLSNDDARARHPAHFRLGSTVLARLAASGETAPGGESRATFLARAHSACALVREPLFHPSARALVVSHGGLLAWLVTLLLGHEPRDGATIGFEHCGVARLVAYTEEPAFGPHAMLLFS